MDELTEAYTESVFGNTQDGADTWEAARTSGNTKGSTQEADHADSTGRNGAGTSISPRSTASGSNTRSSGADDYYINPDDYDSDEEYAKALMAGVRDSMQNGEGEAFWVANGYAAGAEGLSAMNKDIEDALGQLGVAVATDELNANDEANSGANGQSASSGAQNAQSASGETQAAQPTQPTQTTQPAQSAPVQTQGTEPVIQMPEYELYSPAAPTVAEQIQQAQQDANLRDLERLGAVTEDDQETDGNGYISFNDSVPTWQEVEEAYQEAQTASEAEREQAENMRVKYAENMWEQFYNVDSILHMDAFLKDHGFSAGTQGYGEVWQTVETMLGKDEFAALRERLEPDSTVVMMSPEAYEEMVNTPPSIEGDYGTINIDGEDVKILPWTWEYNKYSPEVIDHYKGKVTDWNLADFLLNLNFELNDEGGTDVGTNVTNALLLANQVFAAYTHSYATVDVLDLDGEKRVVIKVSDSAWDSVSKEAGEEMNDLIHGTSITLDKKHTEGEFGYIYFEGDKMILRPLIYPDDKYLVFQDNEYVDITNQMRRDYEVPEEMAEWIEEALNNAGLTIDLS